MDTKTDAKYAILADIIGQYQNKRRPQRAYVYSQPLTDVWPHSTMDDTVTRLRERLPNVSQALLSSLATSLSGSFSLATDKIPMDHLESVTEFPLTEEAREEDELMYKAFAFSPVFLSEDGNEALVYYEIDGGALSMGAAWLHYLKVADKWVEKSCLRC